MTTTSPIDPLVIAHRGLHGVRGPVQNSLGAFEAAASAGADVLELDVRRTRDGVLVVHHDPVTRSGQRIADVDYRDLDPLPDGQRLPTLAEAVDLVRRRGRRVIVELKEQGYEQQVTALLLAALPIEQFQCMSFEPMAIARIEGRTPQVRTGLVVPWVPDWLRDGLSPRSAHAWQATAAQAAITGADFVMLHRLFATDRAIDAARSAGVRVYVTTLDTERQLRKFIDDPRVDGVMTNRADLAVAVRAARRGRALTGS